MKNLLLPKRSKKAFTLLELTVVILVLLALMTISLNVSTKMTEWKLGRAASESLRSVYSAQRMYLADNPTKAVSEIEEADIAPYMPNGMAIPTIESLTHEQLTIIVNQSPPVVNGGSGDIYDPSGSSKDLLWDVGE